MTIPRTIFQTWKDKDDIPERFRYWSSTFQAKNPHYRYVLWDDNDNRNFIARDFNWFLHTYDSYTFNICRVDAVRYFYLYTFGGFYADMDTECLRPLDGLLDLADVILGLMGQDRSFRHSIPNAIMASKPKQEFWLLVAALLMSFSSRAWRPEYLTGPVLLKTAVDIYLSGDVRWIESFINPVRTNLSKDQQPLASVSTIELLGDGMWYAIDWSNPDHDQLRLEVAKGHSLDDKDKKALYGDAWMVTYWTHTWE
ncbi:MAG TPA: glycosyltransferase [Edaphobacter sp.]|nr:glycosyltransferase [Edaphobacter sp.]